MPLLALCAVLLAAFTHATWNLAVKRATGCRHFIWIYSVGAVVVWMPAVIWVLVESRPTFDALQWFALLGTAALHLGYSLALQSGYRSADLSVVYPVARGTGPVLSFLGAALILGERPGVLSVLGLILVVAGICLVTGLLCKGNKVAPNGLSWGLVTGVFIAAYTLNDGWAVKVLLIHPLVVDAAGNIFRVIVLSPQALSERAQLWLEIKQYYRPALVVSVLGTFGYVMILFAMKVAPISHVAPARELATLAGAYFGARLLKEGFSTQRLLGALCIVGGVTCLTLSS